LDLNNITLKPFPLNFKQSSIELHGMDKYTKEFKEALLNSQIVEKIKKVVLN